MFSTKKCNLNQSKLKLSVLSGALLLALMTPVYAETSANTLTVTSTKSYSIPAGPLANTLRSIEKVSGQNIRFDGVDVQDVSAPAIQGNFETVQAVQQAIANSGLTVSTLPSGVIQVHVYRLGTITVTAERGEAEKGFTATRSDTATRSGAELKDVPQTITVVTSKVIETQQAQSIQDVLANVAGVVTRESAQGVPSFSVRGFAAQGGLSNGLSNPYAASTNVAGIDKIEVLKGPQAILSGADSLGGVVNVVTKKPTAERVRDLTLAYGSHDDISAAVDIGDAITEDKKLSYRVIGAAARADHNDAGFNGRENNYLLAQLRWKDNATDLTVGVSYDDLYIPQNRYTFALNGYIQPEPTMLLGNVGDGVSLKSKSVFYDLEHSFNEWVTVISRLQYSEIDQDLNTWTTRFPASSANMIMGMGNSNNTQNYKTLSGDHYARFDFDTGFVRHKVSVGINHSSTELTQTEYNGTMQMVPVHGSQWSFPETSRDASNIYSIYNSDSRSYGYFLQDLITAGDWHFLLGARRTETTYKPSSTYYPTWDTSTDVEEKTRDASNYNLGVVYNLTNNTSVYASYAQGFTPQIPSGTLCSGGNQFPNMKTENKEFGFKGNSKDGALSWGAAVYQLDQANRLKQDPTTYCYIPEDAQRLRGVELEVAGRILPGLNLTAGYTYTDSENRADKTELPGAQPEHQVNLWSTYDFQSVGLSGWGVSLGVTAWSDFLIGYSADDVKGPGGARVDAGISYTESDWSLRLGVKNVFDRTLYVNAFSPLYVPVQDGRTATLTWKYSF